MRRRSGVTLVELLVVLAILATVSALSSVALRRIDAPHAAGEDELLRALRHDAVRGGVPLTRVIAVQGTPHLVTALPDGRVHADTALHLDFATGARHEPAR